jgi:hypothetical protein
VLVPDIAVAAIGLPRAEESSIAVIVGGLIPFVGAMAVVWLLWRAVRSNPENDLPEDERLGAGWVHGVPPEGHPLAAQAKAEAEAEKAERAKKEGGPEDPPS